VVTYKCVSELPQGRRGGVSREEAVHRVERWLGLVVLAWVLALMGCQGKGGSEPTAAVEEQVPTDGERYLALSKANLSALLNVDPDEITLESLITPGDRDGIYEIKLLVGGHVYEYLGQGEGILLVREEATAEP
jgi:hypothetical protein